MQIAISMLSARRFPMSNDIVKKVCCRRIQQRISDCSIIQLRLGLTGVVCVVRHERGNNLMANAMFKCL